MKTVAFFSGYFLPHTGGVERYEYNLAKQLKKHGVRVIIVTTNYEEGLKEVEENEYAKIYRLPIYKLFSKRYPIIKKNKKYNELIKKLKEEKIDYCILNTRFWLTSLVGAKFANDLNIPRCLIEHGSSHFTVYNKVLDFFGEKYEHVLTNEIKKYVKDFYGVSKACCKWLEHFNIEAKGVLSNAIDISEYKEVVKNNKDTIRILYAGRLIKDKGVLILVQAYEELTKKYPNIILTLAGDGELYEDLSKKSNIEVLGKLNHEDMMEMYLQSDIFVSPSKFPEGLPTTILEAGLMKCAVIATNMGGTAEIIEDNKTGFICKPEVFDIIEKLELLLKNEKLRKDISENLHTEVINRFSWENTTKNMLKIIEE